MKILFFVSGTIRSNFSYRPLALARSLHKLGHDVAIVAPKADKYNDFVPEAIDAIDGVRIIQPFQFASRRPELNLLPYLFGAAKTLFAEKPDLIYIYKPTPVSVVGILGKWFRSTPTITDFDDLGSDVMKLEGHPLHQRKLVEWSERSAARNADRIVAASAFLQDHFRKQFPGKPVYLMSNGVDKEWFTDGVVPEKGRRIIFMGSINRRSILEPLFDVLPEVLARIPDARILIMGDGKDLPYFKEKCATLGIAAAVQFTGWLALADARANLHEGDIGYSYMPDEITVKAASNMKVPQYMARGTVPLVSDVNDMHDDPAFLAAGYVAKTGSNASLRDVLIDALNDSRRLEKARRAVTFACERFDWDKLAIGFDRWIKQ